MDVFLSNQQISIDRMEFFRIELGIRRILREVQLYNQLTLMKMVNRVCMSFLDLLNYFYKYLNIQIHKRNRKKFNKKDLIMKKKLIII
jgi:hypothetical protein